MGQFFLSFKVSVCSVNSKEPYSQELINIMDYLNTLFQQVVKVSVSNDVRSIQELPWAST